MLFTFVLDTSVFQEATASTRHPALQVLVVVMVVLVMGTVMVAMVMATVTRANNGDIEVLLHENKLLCNDCWKHWISSKHTSQLW